MKKVFSAIVALVMLTFVAQAQAPATSAPASKPAATAKKVEPAKKVEEPKKAKEVKKAEEPKKATEAKKVEAKSASTYSKRLSFTVTYSSLP